MENDDDGDNSDGDDDGDNGNDDNETTINQSELILKREGERKREQLMNQIIHN